MYTYYAMHTLGVKPVRLISMAITSFQILQMLAGIFVVGYANNQLSQGNPCDVQYSTIRNALIMYASYFVLFVNFFIQAYIINPSREKHMRHEKACSPSFKDVNGNLSKMNSSLISQTKKCLWNKHRLLSGYSDSHLHSNTLSTLFLTDLLLSRISLRSHLIYPVNHLSFEDDLLSHYNDDILTQTQQYPANFSVEPDMSFEFSCQFWVPKALFLAKIMYKHPLFEKSLGLSLSPRKSSLLCLIAASHLIKKHFLGQTQLWLDLHGVILMREVYCREKRRGAKKGTPWNWEMVMETKWSDVIYSSAVLLLSTKLKECNPCNSYFLYMWLCVYDCCAFCVCLKRKWCFFLAMIYPFWVSLQKM